jgi:hypothetical protein
MMPVVVVGEGASKRPQTNRGPDTSKLPHFNVKNNLTGWSLYQNVDSLAPELISNDDYRSIKDRSRDAVDMGLRTIDGN